MTTLLTSIICSLTVLGSVMGDMFTLEGYVGGNVQITCPHELAHNNSKYFCNAVCETDKDIIIKSATNHNPVTRGRYSLFDEGSGVFIVTISNLEESDSGTYWCGVERFIKDTFHKVILKVLEAPEPTSHTTPRLSDCTSKGTGDKIPESDSGILHSTKSPVDTDSSTEEPNAEMFCIK
ncbi:hypothetical protein MHYP_G00103400 [Metynnis hypsauchen]